MIYDKLTEACRKLGYHGICPEALKELELIDAERRKFLNDLRQLLAPKDEADKGRDNL